MQIAGLAADVETYPAHVPGGTAVAWCVTVRRGEELAERRGSRNLKGLPRLTIDRILAWAEAYCSATGRWPSAGSGPVDEAPAPDETWAAIDRALRFGFRGLPGGQSLARLRRPARPGR